MESTNSSDIRRKSEERMKNKKSFSKAKRAKVLNVRENSLALQQRTVETYGTSLKEELGSYERFMELPKGNPKERERDREFFCNQKCIQNPVDHL